MDTIHTLGRDIRYAARILRKTPGFTLTAALTLGLTIGANTAVFSIVDTLLLRPLPYPDPDQLAILATRVESASRGVSSDQTSQDGRTWEMVRDHAKTVDRAPYSGWVKGVNLVTPAGAIHAQQQRVAAGFFSVLGVAPLIGREFDATEDRPNGPAAAILSYHLWQQAFGGNAAVVGGTIHMRGDSYTVVGVMPQGFRSSAPADLWTPLRPSTTGEGGGANYGILLRLRDGHTWPQANSELAALGAELRQQRARGGDWRPTTWAMPLQQGLTESVRRPLVILWAAVALVLLIACINVAGLLLARGSTRAREIATRMAIGSGRAAVVRQLLVESLLLAAMGGALGVVLGWIGLELLSGVAQHVFNVWQPLALDARVLLVMAAVVITSAIIFGLAPAWHASRIDIQPVLMAVGARGATSAFRWPRQVLIVAEVALGVVLLVSAGLLVRTFLNLSALRPGFDARGVIAATVSLDDVRYRDPQRVARLFDDTLARIRQTPGVEAAAVSLGVPYQRLLNLVFRRMDGIADPSRTSMTNVSYITPEFFRTLRIPSRRGRTFDARDRPDSSGVVVVNDAFVRHYYQNEDPVGRRISISGREREIIGIVGEVQLSNPGWGGFGPVGTPPMVYLPVTQTNEGFLGLVHGWFSPVWVVRSTRGVQDLEPVIRSAVASADAQLPLARIEPMEDVVRLALAQQRFMAVLLTVLGAIAALLAAIGIHGLIAASVTERTRELGIRMALGATVGRAMRTVAAPGVVLAVAGIVIGAVMAVWAVRLLQSQLWGIEPRDPLTFGGVIALLLSVATLASVVPTLRVLRMDPADTLRSE